MQLLQAERTYDELIQHMRENGYSESYLDQIEKEICWIEKNQKTHHFASYEEACLARCQLTESNDMKEKYRAIYGLFTRYAAIGCTWDGHREPLFHCRTYLTLSPYYKTILDIYEQESIKNGLKAGTYKASISACSGLFSHFQQHSIETLEAVRESDVLAYFCDKNGNVRLSNSTKVNIASVFNSELGAYTATARVISSYLPKLKRHRKTIQYLTEDEIASIKDALQNGKLSLRDKAIGILLLFTGMRASDISSIQMDNIDWDKEEICLLQQKTGVLLTLPLMIQVGNSLYEYIRNERPKCKSTYVFLSETTPVRRISPGTVGNVADKLYRLSGIRQDSSDQKGAHLFRHNVATALISKNIPRPVISATLGHNDPDSLNHYLYADITHLRECSLSVERFPVRKGVFEI